jgi:hypothetical protein
LAELAFVLDGVRFGHPLQEPHPPRAPLLLAPLLVGCDRSVHFRPGYDSATLTDPDAATASAISVQHVTIEQDSGILRPQKDLPSGPDYFTAVPAGVK